MTDLVQPSSAYDYLLEEVVITADRFTDRGATVSEWEVSSVIAELSLFENLSKPFITGEIVLGDFDGLLDTIDFQGTERIKITLRIPGFPDPNSSQSIVRNFYIDSIVQSGKGNDHVEVLLLSIIEDKGYKNFLQNVNKSYRKLSGDQIIEAIYNNYISFKDTDSLSKVQNLGNPDGYTPYTCVIPNWHPFDATKWVVDRMTHENGFPHYFYSVAGHPDIFLNDLETMVNQDIRNLYNEKIPYVYSQVSANVTSNNNIKYGSHVIEGYTTQAIEDNFEIIKDGYIGADYQRLDIGLDLPRIEKYEYSADLVFNGSLPWDPIDRSVKVDDKRQFEYNSHLASEVVATNTYGTNEPGYADVGTLQQAVKRNAYTSWIPKVTVQLTIPGRNFFPIENIDDLEKFTKVGDKIYVEILKNKAIEGGEDANPEPSEVIDKKRTGDYIIYAIRHMFTINPQKYKVILECFKLTTSEDNTSITQTDLADLLGVGA